MNILTSPINYNFTKNENDLNNALKNLYLNNNTVKTNIPKLNNKNINTNFKLNKKTNSTVLTSPSKNNIYQQVHISDKYIRSYQRKSLCLCGHLQNTVALWVG